LDIVFGNIAINVSCWTTIIAASVTLVIYTKLITWFELWRGRRVSRRMAQCRARLYAR
jgi:heme/copper-type cytochrome/quinol oxidase subunit 1